MPDTVNRLRYIAYNEGLKGHRIRVRTALLTAGWEDMNLDLMYPGADMFWTTATGKSVGVQSKLVLDFIQSWFDGRLQRQLYDLIACVDIPVLLIELGRWPYDSKTGDLVTVYGKIEQGKNNIPYRSFAHALADLVGFAPGRFSLILSPDTDFTIEWLIKLGQEHFDQDQFHGWDRIELPARSKNTAVEALLGFKGLGEARARKLLSEFHTVFGVIDALHMNLWELIPGIGRGIQDACKRQGKILYKEEK